MSRVKNGLTAALVKNTKAPGFYFDGNGLALQISPSGTKSWVFRYTSPTTRKQRSMGMGRVDLMTLAEARDKILDMRRLVASGDDPMEQRTHQRAAAKRQSSIAFAEAAQIYAVKKQAEFTNDHYKHDWLSSLKMHVFPALGSMSVDAITMRDVLAVIEPIWHEKTETAKRIRGRIERVLDWCAVMQYRSGENPARWVGNLKEILPAPSKIMHVRHQPAVAVTDAPRFWADLYTRDGFGAAALRFAMLTAARSGEVRGATYGEIDIEAAIWCIQAERMKMKRPHRVPLSRQAVALLRNLPRLHNSPYVFPAEKGGKLSDMTLSAVMRRIHAFGVASGGGYFDTDSKAPAVPHGLRSTFRDWAASQEAKYPNALAEKSLAHKTGNAVEAAYQRDDMLDQRRPLMQEWADYVAGG